MKTIIISISLLMLFSCSKNSDKAIENIKIYYNNGIIFCHGKHSFNNNDEKIRIDNWKFFYPNGKIRSEIDYDKVGKIISRKEYSYRGNLVLSEDKKDNILFQKEYYPNGKIKEEIIEKEIYEEDEGEEFYSYETTIKEYYENGLLAEQREYFNNKLNGEIQVWDSSGNHMIRVNYKDGIILTAKE